MKILFCSDGSPEAEKAVRFGAFIAESCHAEATILGICEAPGDEEPLLQSLRRSQEVLKQHQVNAELVTKSGRPVPEIVKRSQEPPFDLVVIGAQRRPGRSPVLRSVKAYQILEAVVPPVLVVVGEPRPLRRILLCSGGGAQADKAVEFAVNVAHCGEAAVTLFHVLAAPPALLSNLLGREEDVEQLLRSDSALGRRLRAQQAAFERMGVACDVRVRHGLVVPELLAELESGAYDLVVAGSSPRRDRLRAYMMGNVTRELVNHADWPVLIVRSGVASPRWGGFVSGFFRHAQPTAR
jgi:nucleotide-binding universal stress UspA family protein